MKRISGFTVIELVIIIALIVILVMLAANLPGFRKAGAAELPPTLYSVLSGTDTSFVYADGSLYIVDKGTATWESPAVACSELKAFEPRLTTVVFNVGKEASAGTELRWNKDHTNLTNLPEREEATCK